MNQIQQQKWRMYFHAVKMEILMSNQGRAALDRIRPSRQPDARDAFSAGFMLGCAATDKSEALDCILWRRP